MNDINYKPLTNNTKSYNNIKTHINLPTYNIV